jgi:magnesium and cobalt transporter
VTQQFGHLPERGETAELNGLQFTVLSADGRTIRLLRVTPGDQAAETDGDKAMEG